MSGSLPKFKGKVFLKRSFKDSQKKHAFTPRARGSFTKLHPTKSYTMDKTPEGQCLFEKLKSQIMN